MFLQFYRNVVGILCYCCVGNSHLKLSNCNVYPWIYVGFGVYVNVVRQHFALCYAIIAASIMALRGRDFGYRRAVCASSSNLKASNGSTSPW